jgi:hypothetical protein
MDGWMDRQVSRLKKERWMKSRCLDSILATGLLNMDHKELKKINQFEALFISQRQNSGSYLLNWSSFVFTTGHFHFASNPR